MRTLSTRTYTPGLYIFYGVESKDVVKAAKKLPEYSNVTFVEHAEITDTSLISIRVTDASINEDAAKTIALIENSVIELIHEIAGHTWTTDPTLQVRVCSDDRCGRHNDDDIMAALAPES